VFEFSDCVLVPVIIFDTRTSELHVTDGKPANESSNKKACVWSPLFLEGEFFFKLWVSSTLCAREAHSFIMCLDCCE
jgi:hypothetical protein